MSVDENKGGVYRILGLREALDECGFIVHRIKGVSMNPTLWQETDSVRLIPSDGTGLKKYDIPLYVRSDGSYVLHRIIGRRDDGVWIIRGDNCLCKEYIRPEQIIAVAEGYYRNGEYYRFDTKEAERAAKRAIARHPFKVARSYCGRLKNKLIRHK